MMADRIIPGRATSHARTVLRRSTLPGDIHIGQLHAWRVRRAHEPAQLLSARYALFRWLISKELGYGSDSRMVHPPPPRDTTTGSGAHGMASSPTGGSGDLTGRWHSSVTRMVL